jgi:hypothetical protein
MAEESGRDRSSVGHGVAELPVVEVTSYNLELRDGDGFLGDRACGAAFRHLLEEERRRARWEAADPFGEGDADAFTKREIDAMLRDGPPEGAAVVVAAIEGFSARLAGVIQRFRRRRSWRAVRRVVIGGGFRRSRVGELAIARAGQMLTAAGIPLALRPIRLHPDDAGLVGSARLTPLSSFGGRDHFLAVDIGGSNIRCGIVRLGADRAADGAAAAVWRRERWRHAEAKPSRSDIIAGLIDMIGGLIGAARRRRIELAPLIGIGCPGVIEADGTIDRGGHNLPGNWHSARFNLIDEIRRGIPEIGGEPTRIVLHNDAVVQGLSEAPFMRDVDDWAVLTIGTGLGNATYRNRPGATAGAAPDGAS